MRGAQLLLAALFLTALAGYARAETTQGKLQNVEKQIDTQKDRAADLDQKAQDTAENLKDLRARLVTATAALQAKEEEEGELEDKLAGTSRDVSSRRTSLGDEKKKLKALTAALVELARRPPETLLLETGLGEDYIRRRILLRAILPAIEERAGAIIEDIGTLDEMKAKAEQQRRLIAASRHNLEQQQAALDQLIRVRQGLLQRTEQQKADIAKQLVSLSNEAKDLHQLLDKLTPSRRHNHNSPPAAAPFDIRWPVEGNLTRRFGDRDRDGVVSEGETFAALSGSPVVAPAPGRVVFAGPFRGYGQIVILQHDGGYHSFLAGFGRIDAEMGEDVDAGEPLGVLPAAENQRPELYFEWRHDNEPVDPARGASPSKGRN